MNSTVLAQVQSYDHYITPAAISDIKFDLSKEKIKKEKLNDSLPIKKDEDILSNVLKIKKENQKIVGFAASHLNEKVMIEKYKRKPVDLLIGTLVNSGVNGKDQKGFYVDQAEYMILENGENFQSYQLKKKELASMIIERLEK